MATSSALPTGGIRLRKHAETAPGYRNFLVDRTTRLGKPGKPPPEFAFHSRRRLEPIQRCNASTIHESRIHAFHQIQIVWVYVLMVRN